MSSVSIVFNTRPYSEGLEELLERYDDLGDVMDDIGAYMVRSIQNRILRLKRDPKNNQRWAPLKESTIRRKGHASILFDSGELADSIDITNADERGFTVSAGADHAGYMQFGTTGKRATPARPFIGFSETNKRRVSRMLRDYLAEGATNFYGDAE